MDSITISIVVCHYEQPEELRKSLLSIACQLRPADQIIVVDDGSCQPPSKSTLDKICGYPVTLLLNSKNHGGPATPRNQAIDACKSSHLVFLDADDILMPNALQGMAMVWAENPFAVAHGDQISWGSSLKNPFLQRSIQQTKDWKHQTSRLYEELLAGGNRLFLSGSGGPTKLFASNRFDPTQHWEDFDLWLRLAQSGHDFIHTGFIHTLYRLQQGSRSGSKRARHRGCKGIKQKHLQKRPPWKWPIWYWKQRFL